MAFIISFLLGFDLSAQPPNVADGKPDGWPQVLNNPANTKKSFRHDPFQVNGIDDGFTQGSKDNSPISNWRWVYGNSNDKGDIANAGAVIINNVLYFFGDRAAFNGNAQIGFWFFKDSVRQTGDGSNPGSPFLGSHTNGDLLIISNFVNGGGNAQPTIYRWEGKTATEPGEPKLFAGANAGLTTNTGTETVPDDGIAPPPPPRSYLMFNGESWTFKPKGAAEGTYPPPLFFEGYVDLTDIPEATCFQSFLLETRESQSITAALVDMVAGRFSGIPDPPTVTPGEKCVDQQPVILGASCAHTSGTPTWYTAASGGTALGTSDGVSADGSTLTKSGLPVGVTTYYVSCKDGECESARVPVTATIFPLPTVDGVITEGENANPDAGGPDDGVEKVSDDIYRIRISRTAVASLTATASGGTGSYTYLWTRINCDGTSFVDDGKTTFTSSGANGTFTVLPNPVNLALAYCFKVTVTDGKTCVATDIVQIRPTVACPPCGISGPATACKDAQATYTYVDPATSLPAALPTDYDLTWTKPDGTTVTNVTSITVPLATVGNNTVSIAFSVKPGGVSGNCPGCTKSTDVRQVSLSLAGNNLTCYQAGNGSIVATFADGFPPYSISLNGVVTANVTSTHTFPGLSAGLYTVVITDAQSCIDSKQITLTQPPLLTCNLTAPTPLSCGTSGTVSGTITGGTAGYTCSAAFDATGTAGGWIVTGCSVTGTGISVSYTSGASVTSSVLTLTVTDANGCTSTCSTAVQCTGGHGCTPGFWQGGSGKTTWDEGSDPVAIAVGFTAGTSFYTVFPAITPGTCGLPTSLTMIEAITLGGGNCNKLVRHGVAAILNASTLPDYPLPAGIATVAALKTAITNAINACDCESLATEIAANNELNHDLCGQVLISRVVAAAKILSDLSSDLVMEAYPNPYNSVVNFRFTSPKSGKATLEVYDVVGRRLAIVYQGTVTAKTPMNVRYNVPSVNRVALFYKLSVDDKSVRGSILPDK